MFGARLVHIGRCVIRRIGQREQANLTRCIFNQTPQCLWSDFSAHDLKNFLVPDERLKTFRSVARQENTDGVRRALLCFAKRVESTHTGQVLSGDNNMNWRFAKSGQCFTAAGRTMHCITIVKPCT